MQQAVCGVGFTQGAAQVDSRHIREGIAQLQRRVFRHSALSRQRGKHGVTIPACVVQTLECQHHGSIARRWFQPQCRQRSQVNRFMREVHCTHQRRVNFTSPQSPCGQVQRADA